MAAVSTGCAESDGTVTLSRVAFTADPSGRQSPTDEEIQAGDSQVRSVGSRAWSGPSLPKTEIAKSTQNFRVKMGQSSKVHRMAPLS